jgi:hypothetical protein
MLKQGQRNDKQTTKLMFPPFTQVGRDDKVRGPRRHVGPVQQGRLRLLHLPAVHASGRPRPQPPDGGHCRHLRLRLEPAPGPPGPGQGPQVGTVPIQDVERFDW